MTDAGLLQEIIGDRKAESWVVLRGEAGGELLEGLTAQILRYGRALDPKRDWSITVGASLPAGLASIEARRSVVPTATSVQLGLMDLAEVARSKGRPILVVIDELHEVQAGELKAVTAAANQLNGTGHPLMILTAEIPGRADLSHVTYFRDRAVELPVGHLPDRAAADALLAPARAQGVDWSPDAVDHVVRAANGYPYALQTHAAQAWMSAPAGGPIDLAAAIEGVRQGRRELSHMYRRRWEEHPDRPRRFLAAVAHLTVEERPVSTATVAEVLGDASSSWSGDAARLRESGAIISTSHGQVQLGVPGWDSWIRALQKREHMLDDAQCRRAHDQRRRLVSGADRGSPASPPPSRSSGDDTSPDDHA